MCSNSVAQGKKRQNDFLITTQETSDIIKSNSFPNLSVTDMGYLLVKEVSNEARIACLNKSVYRSVDTSSSPIPTGYRGGFLVRV